MAPSAIRILTRIGATLHSQFATLTEVKPLLRFARILCCSLLLAHATQAEDPKRPGAYAIRDARLVTVSGPVIERGVLVIRDGLIAAVGAGTEIPPDAWVIEGAGLTVYPGLIDAKSGVGLPAAAFAPRSDPVRGASNQERAEPPMPRGPQDRPLTTSWKVAADLFDPADKRIEAWRNSGFTTLVSTPSGGIFSGQASVINLAGERSGEMTVEPRAALSVEMPARRGAVGFPNSLLGRVSYIKQVFLDVEHYRQARAIYSRAPRGIKRPAYDRAIEPIGQLLAAGRPVMLPGNDLDEIYRSLRIAKHGGIETVIYGGHEGYRAAEQLAGAKVAVLVNLTWPAKLKDPDPEEEESLRTLRLRDRAPSTPAALDESGVRYAFYTGGEQKPGEVFANIRRALAQGLAAEQGIRALTLSAAEIFGVDDRLGSLEAGKIANVLVTQGDLFDEKCVRKFVFIDGKKFDIPASESSKPDEKNEAEEPE